MRMQRGCPHRSHSPTCLPEAMPLDVLYEDAHLIVLNKRSD